MQRSTTARIGFALVAICHGFVPTLVEASSSEWNVSAFIEGAGYVAEEYRFGRLFNREVGTLVGPHLRVHYAYRPWRVDIEHRSLSNTIAYHGQNQIGVPIESQTNLHYSQSGSSVTYQLHDTPYNAGLALRTREIDRRIHATPITQALHETLRQTEWGLVAGAEKRLSENIFVAGQVMALVTQRSTLAVDFLGTYDAGELTLPRNSSHELRLSLHYDVNSSFALTTEICGQRFSPARSSSKPLTRNGTPIGTYSYPGSTQEIWTVGAGALVQW